MASDVLRDTSVVIPVYFNEKTVAVVVENVRREWAKAGRAAEDLEFVLVDDGSEDGSWGALRALHAADPAGVTTLRLARNHGSWLAIMAGASLARGGRVAMIAADGQEPADLVPRMVEAADGGSRIVLATRKSRADSLSTRVSAAVFYQLIRLFGLSRMPKKGFDAFLLERGIVDALVAMKDPNVPLPVLVAWLGYPYAEVEYDRLERMEGKSRWTLRKKIKYAVDAIAAVSYTPIRAISAFGTLLAIAGFLYAIFIILDRVVVGTEVRGWTSLFVAVLVIGGTQLLALGIIGEYLWRTLEVVRNRPLWRVAEVEDERARTNVEV